MRIVAGPTTQSSAGRSNAGRSGTRAAETAARKQRLLLACAHTVSHDNQIRPEEGELLRAVSDALGCPMPPLLGELSAPPPPAAA